MFVGVEFRVLMVPRRDGSPANTCYVTTFGRDLIQNVNICEPGLVRVHVHVFPQYALTCGHVFCNIKTSASIFLTF
jgi:hypothetical protein